MQLYKYSIKWQIRCHKCNHHL